MPANANAESSDAARGSHDRCPYSRSFTEEFARNPQCAAYQGTTFTVTDTSHRRLGSALTCRHLAVGSDIRAWGRFYPRCALGDARQRLQWVARLTPARLAVMRSLEEEFDQLTRDDRDRLLATKSRLLDNASADGASMDALEVQLSAFLDRVDELISERSERLADVGLRASQLRTLVSDWSLAWLRSHDLFGPDVAGLLGGRFVPDTAALLGADLEDAGDFGGQVVAQAGPLVIERDPADHRLRVSGEVDVSNADALGTAVAEDLVVGDVTVDFSDVLFCDLSGLRALVRAAASGPRGHRISVVGLPEHLQRAVRMVGWSELPGLLIVETAQDRDG